MQIKAYIKIQLENKMQRRAEANHIVSYICPEERDEWTVSDDSKGPQFTNNGKGSFH